MIDLSRAAVKWAEQLGPEALAIAAGTLLTDTQRTLLRHAEQVEQAAVRYGLDREALGAAVSDALARSLVLEFDDALRDAVGRMLDEPSCDES